MAFNNDYLTEEEKAKFEEYNVMYPERSSHAGLRLGVGSGRKRCTVDREREMYLFHDINSLERREFICSIDYFTLVIVRNDVVSVAYFNLEDISTTIEYHEYWKIRGMDTSLLKGITKEEALVYLKEALHTYGISGRPGSKGARIGFDF